MNSMIKDEFLQNALANPYCNKTGFCERGTHVMCMYGGEQATTMGPRCSDGKTLALYNSERLLITDVLNGLRRALTMGEEILGKDGVKLPQAFGLRKIFWDDELEKFAQVWANQCTVDLDRCRSTDRFYQASQTNFIIRFNYPNWTIPSVSFVYDIPELTLEKRRFVIEKFFKSIYDQRKNVTLAMIEQYTGSGEDNSYLMAVYSMTRRVGCGMSSWLDYLRTLDETTMVTNAVFIVCNFSARPKDQNPVYNLQRSGSESVCGCSKFVRENECLCVDFEDPIEVYEAPPWPSNYTATENDTKNDKSPGEGGGGQLPGICKGEQCSPPVVLMPIFTVEDGDPKTQQLGGNQDRAMMEQTRRKQEMRKEIKNRVEKVRDQYFKNYAVLEPKTGFSNKGPIDENTFVLSKFVPIKKVSNIRKEVNYNEPIKKQVQLSRINNTRKELTINQPIKRKLQMSRRELSDLDDLVSEYLRSKLNNLTNSLIDEDQISDMIKSITKDYKDRQIIKNTGVRYGESNLYHKNEVSMGDLKNKHGGTINTLLPESDKNIKLYTRKSSVAQNMPQNQYTSIQTKQKGDLMENIDSAEVTTDYIDDSIEHQQNVFKARRNYLPTRNLKPLNPYAGKGNSNHRHIENHAEHRNLAYNKPKSSLMSLDHKYRQFYDYDAKFDKASYGRSRHDKHKVYDRNRMRNDYYNRSNHGRISRQNDERLRQNRRHRGDRGESQQEQRYYVPDRRHTSI